MVTSHRVVFCARPRWAAGFGVIGMLIAKPNRVDVELNRHNITGSREDEKGMLSVASADGEFRFGVSAPSAWLAVIGQPQAGAVPTA